MSSSSTPVGTPVSYGWFIYPPPLNLVNLWWYGDPGSQYNVYQTTDFVNWTLISYLQASIPHQYMAVGIPFDQAGKFTTVIEAPALKV